MLEASTVDPNNGLLSDFGGVNSIFSAGHPKYLMISISYMAVILGRHRHEFNKWK